MSLPWLQIQTLRSSGSGSTLLSKMVMPPRPRPPLHNVVSRLPYFSWRKSRPLPSPPKGSYRPPPRPRLRPTWSMVPPATRHSSPTSTSRPGTAATTVSAGCTCSFSGLDILEWRRLEPAVARQLLQHHGASVNSCLGPGLGRRLRRVAPHHSVSW
jgi:hypothetical protein